MKRAIVIIVVIAVLVIAGLFWWKSPATRESRNNAKKKVLPQIEMANLQITDMDKEKVSLTANLIIRNPLPADLKAQNLRYKIMIDSVKVIETRYDKNVTVRSNDSAVISVPMSFKIDAMKDVVARLDREKRDSADYAVNAQFDLDVPVAGQRNFDINFNKRMLAVRPVKIKPGKVDIDNFGLKDTEVKMEMTVSNPNPFSISLKDAAFTMKIENDLEVEGRIPETVRIPAKGSENISMVSEVKTAKMPKLGWKLLFRKPETNYNVLFKTRLVSENEMLNGSKMNVTMTGTLQDLKEVASKKK